MDCLENYACASPGTVSPVACPDGTVTPTGSAACRNTVCDFEKYYYDTVAKVCKERKVFCNYTLQYEVPTPLNQTRERECKALSPCDTSRMASPTYPVQGAS